MLYSTGRAVLMMFILPSDREVRYRLISCTRVGLRVFQTQPALGESGTVPDPVSILLPVASAGASAAKWTISHAPSAPPA